MIASLQCSVIHFSLEMVFTQYCTQQSTYSSWCHCSVCTAPDLSGIYFDTLRRIGADSTNPRRAPFALRNQYNFSGLHSVQQIEFNSDLHSVHSLTRISGMRSGGYRLYAPYSAPFLKHCCQLSPRAQGYIQSYFIDSIHVIFCTKYFQKSYSKL